MMMCLGGMSIGLDGTAERARGVLESVLLEIEQAQLIGRTEMRIVGFERPLVQPFGFPKSALAVQRHSLVEDLGRPPLTQIRRRSWSAQDCRPARPEVRRSVQVAANSRMNGCN